MNNFIKKIFMSGTLGLTMFGYGQSALAKPKELFAASNAALNSGLFSTSTYTITNGKWDYGTRKKLTTPEVTLQTRIKDRKNYHYDVIFFEPTTGIDYKRGHYLFAVDMKRPGKIDDYKVEFDRSPAFNNQIWLRYKKGGSMWSSLRGASFQLPYHLTTEWKTYYGYANLDTNLVDHLMQGAEVKKIGFYFGFFAHQGNYMLKNFRAWHFESITPLVRARFKEVDFNALTNNKKTIKRSSGTKVVNNRLKVDSHGNISIRQRQANGSLAPQYTPSFPYLIWSQSTATPKAKLAEYGWDMHTEWSSHVKAVKEASRAGMLSMVVVNANEMNGQTYKGNPHDVSWRIIKNEYLTDKLTDNEAEDIVGVILDNEKNSFRDFSLEHHKKVYEDIEEWIGQGLRVALNGTPFSVEGVGGSLETSGFDFAHLHGPYVNGDGNVRLLWKSNYAFGRNVFWAKTTRTITDKLGFKFNKGVWYTCEMAPKYRWKKSGKSPDEDITNGKIIKSELYDKTAIYNLPVKVFENSKVYPGFAQIQSRSGKKFAPLVIAAIANGAKMVGVWEDFPDIQIDSNGKASMLWIKRNDDGTLKRDSDGKPITSRLNYGANWWIQTVGQYADPDIFHNGLAEQLKKLKPITSQMAIDGIIAADSFSDFTAGTDEPFCFAGTKKLADGTRYILFSNISDVARDNVIINCSGLKSDKLTIYDYCKPNCPKATDVNYKNGKFTLNNVKPYSYRVYKINK